MKVRPFLEALFCFPCCGSGSAGLPKRHCVLHAATCLACSASSRVGASALKHVRMCLTLLTVAPTFMSGTQTSPHNSLSCSHPGGGACRQPGGCGQCHCGRVGFTVHEACGAQPQGGGRAAVGRFHGSADHGALDPLFPCPHCCVSPSFLQSMCIV